MALSTIRRKSVNLSPEGIHVPNQSQPHTTQSTSPTASQNSSRPADDDLSPPAKKIKRSQSEGADPESLRHLTSVPKFAVPSSKEIQASPDPPTQQQTLPPSPPASTDNGDIEPLAPPPVPQKKVDSPLRSVQEQPVYKKVDTEGINDDVVIATIEVLERTNNRPHLLKELAAEIAGHVHVVET